MLLRILTDGSNRRMIGFGGNNSRIAECSVPQLVGDTIISCAASQKPLSWSQWRKYAWQTLVPVSRANSFSHALSSARVNAWGISVVGRVMQPGLHAVPGQFSKARLGEFKLGVPRAGSKGPCIWGGWQNGCRCIGKSYTRPGQFSLEGRAQLHRREV